jgi:hypothetical protein
VKHNINDLNAFDAQAALGFVRSQTTHVEAEVYRIKYADIQYQDFIPVDFSAHPFAKTVTYTTLDRAGAAKWLNGNAGDIPRADIEMAQFETAVHTAGIGYGWGWEEVNQAQMLGIALGSEKAAAARRASEEFIDRIALEGDTTKNFNGGLFNHPDVTVTAPTTGAWASATPDQIIADLNQGLQLVNTATNTIIYADTMLLPFERMNLIGSTRLTDTNETILSFFRRNNIYTAQTGSPLMLRAGRGLLTAGVSGDARMVTYRRSPEVMKLHMPMPHRFLPVFQKDGLNWEVPGVMRLGGLDLKLPKEVSYIDGI